MSKWPFTRGPHDPWELAGRKISLDAFKGWTDDGPIAANVFALYCEFGASLDPAEGRGLFGAMARYRMHKHGEHDHLQEVG